jgi:hypothetical protein
MSAKRQTLQTAIRELLNPSQEYNVLGHELWRDGNGWSSNDRFYLARNASVERVLEVARGRWEIFKVNYCSNARIKDLADIGYDGDLYLECAYLPFLDIVKSK